MRVGVACRLMASVQIGALGDIHGDFDAVAASMRGIPTSPSGCCVGDVADDDGDTSRSAAPVYWIKGNNEDFDAIAGRRRCRANAALSAERRPSRVGGVRVAGLGGTFAPTWYDTPAPAALPHPKQGQRATATEQADKRRHFVREEVEACKATARASTSS